MLFSLRIPNHGVLLELLPADARATRTLEWRPGTALLPVAASRRNDSPARPHPRPPGRETRSRARLLVRLPYMPPQTVSVGVFVACHQSYRDLNGPWQGLPARGHRPGIYLVHEHFALSPPPAKPVYGGWRLSPYSIPCTSDNLSRRLDANVTTCTSTSRSRKVASTFPEPSATTLPPP